MLDMKAKFSEGEIDDQVNEILKDVEEPDYTRRKRKLSKRKLRKKKKKKTISTK